MERVEFVLGPSKGFKLFLFFLYLGATAIILWVPIFYFLKMVAITHLFLCFWQTWNLHAKRTSKKSVVRIWQDREGRWGCLTKDGHAAIGALKGDSFKSAWLLILRFQFRSRIFSVVVPADALDFIEFRILYTRLKQSSFI